MSLRLRNDMYDVQHHHGIFDVPSRQMREEGLDHRRIRHEGYQGILFEDHPRSLRTDFDSCWFDIQLKNFKIVFDFA